MTTSEPTTGEIVRALRNGGAYFNLGTIAADRLESQSEENESSRQLIEMQSNIITELTARAEKAEAREKRNLKWANVFRKIARKKYEEVLDWYYASKGF